MDKARLLQDLHKYLETIAKEAKAILMSVMASEKGVNTKVGVNTLVDGRIFQEIETDVEDVELVNLLVNDYITYIESGRRPGTYPPPNVIAEWCQRRGIPSDNRTVYLICRSIYEKGIPARPIFDGNGGVWDMIDKEWSTWSEVIFQTITDYLSEDFND